MFSPRTTLIVTALALALLAQVKMHERMSAADVKKFDERTLSLPGQEYVSFWANHNGLEQCDVEGEVGFGDMARILLRRRSNSELLRGLRERDEFLVKDLAAIQVPDVWRVELTDSGLRWLDHPSTISVAGGRIYNLPLIVLNRSGADTAVDARISASSGHVQAAKLRAGASAGYFLRIVEQKAGGVKRRLTVHAGGHELEADVQVEVLPMVRLRVRLVDEKGGPAQARVYLTGADGLAYAPRGTVNRIAAIPSEYYFHADGSFELDMPAGATLIEATRGIEYELASRTVALKLEVPGEVTIPLLRWVNMAARGWYSSDAHIHANYTGVENQVITPADIQLLTLAEDLNNANLMVANSFGAFIHDERYFTGRVAPTANPNYVMYWNEEMRNRGTYGHMCFYNLKSLVRPLYTGFEDTPNWENYPPNYNQAEAAQRQGGAVTYAHPSYHSTFEGSSAKELPVDLALGQVDAMDVLSNSYEPTGTEIYHRLLNCGFRLAISAGTDSFTNLADHYTPGAGRVYVHLDGPMRYPDWIRNYKKGRSFASNGPVLLLTVNGKEPGEELMFPAGAELNLQVRLEARTRVPLDAVDIIVNGKTVLSRATAAGKAVVIDERIHVNGPSWIAARALGPWSRMILNDAQAFAHTSPVYVTVGGKRAAVASDLHFYTDWIEQLIARVNERGRFASAAHKQEVVDLFQRARAIYRTR